MIFGGKEWIEDLFRGFRGYARARVRNRNLDEFAIARCLNRHGFVGPCRVRCGIQGVQDWIGKHLLQLDRIAVDREGRSGQLTSQHDVARSCLGRQEFDTFGNLIVQVEVLSFEGNFRHIAAQPPDDFGGSAVVAAYVARENLLAFAIAGYVPTNELRVIDPRLKRRPNECSIKTLLGSTSARLLVDVVRAVAIASGTMRRNAEKCRNIERVRQERIAHHRHHPPRTSF